MPYGRMTSGIKICNIYQIDKQVHANLIGWEIMFLLIRINLEIFVFTFEMIRLFTAAFVFKPRRHRPAASCFRAGPSCQK